MGASGRTKAPLGRRKNGARGSRHTPPLSQKRSLRSRQSKRKSLEGRQRQTQPRLKGRRALAGAAQERDQKGTGKVGAGQECEALLVLPHHQGTRGKDGSSSGAVPLLPQGSGWQSA